jgi:hypothetical protein
MSKHSLHSWRLRFSTQFKTQKIFANCSLNKQRNGQFETAPKSSVETAIWTAQRNFKLTAQLMHMTAQDIWLVSKLIPHPPPSPNLPKVRRKTNLGRKPRTINKKDYIVDVAKETTTLNNRLLIPSIPDDKNPKMHTLSTINNETSKIIIDLHSIEAMVKQILKEVNS